MNSGGSAGGLRWSRISGVFLALLLLIEVAAGQTPQTRPSGHLKSRNVILITLDGLRWQEVFGGVDETLMDKDLGGVKDLPELKRRFQRETPVESRKALMPFFWDTLVTQGVVFGDPDHESKAVVTNGLNFSYPGYSEILCGYADPKIDSNAKKNNENVTVLEWISLKPGLRIPWQHFAAGMSFHSSSTKLAVEFPSMLAGNRWREIRN